MNDLHKSLLIGLCLLAFTAVVFFFKYGQERTNLEILKAEKHTAQMRLENIDEQAKAALEKASRAEILSEAERRKASENLEKARTAAKMLEKMRNESAATKKELIANLNAQLEREAEARLAAEEASKELSKQRDNLKISMESTRKALDELKLKNNMDTNAEIERIKALLGKKDSEIAKLKKELEELEELRKKAERLQMLTEQRIINMGGDILLPRPKRLLSPNLRSN